MKMPASACPYTSRIGTGEFRDPIKQQIDIDMILKKRARAYLHTDTLLWIGGYIHLGVF
jgi:hypothetical protein